MKFTRLIKKRSTELTATVENEGILDHGQYTPGNTTKYLVNLAIFNMTAETIEQYPGGNYTTQDIIIYAPEELEAKKVSDGSVTNLTLKKGDVIENNGDDYEIRERDPRTTHSDFYKYVAKKKVIE